MQAMAMTADERAWITRIEEKGNANETKVGDVEKKINSILTLVRGIAIGLAIGGFLTGLVKWQEILKFFTK